MPLNFELVAVNPNDATGGGGTLAGAMHDADATGPYFVWPNQEYESYASPHAVVAASEVRAMYAALDNQPLAGGEVEHDTSKQPQHDTGAGRGPVSPEFDLSDPDETAAALAPRK